MKMTKITRVKARQIKQSWIKALNSGDYIQGRYHLKFRGKLCCLGVLREVALKEHQVKLGKDSRVQLIDNADWSDLFFPKEGMICDSYQTQGVLSTKNDAGVPFKEIAKFIAKVIKV